MNIVLLGPPGANKKMISKELASHLNMSDLSTGQLCDFVLSRKDHPYYKIITKSFQDSLIEDSIIKKMIGLYLQKDTNGIVFSGSPKTIDQASYIDSILFKNDNRISHVFYLDYNRETLIQKLQGRLFCKECEKSFLNKTNLTVCPICNGEILSKESMEQIEENDNEETNEQEEENQEPKLTYSDLISKRIDTYNKIITPILSYYTQRNKVIKIKLNGNESIENIKLKILDFIE